MAADLIQDAPPEAAVDVVVMAAKPYVRRIARFPLETSGVRVAITDDGHTAARAMCRGGPQVLITDRDMLRLPATAKLSEMKQRHGALRIAVVDDPSPGHVARPAGVDVVLSWPAVRHELLDCLPKGSAYCRCRGNAMHSSPTGGAQVDLVGYNRPRLILSRAIIQGSHSSVASARVRWPRSPPPQSVGRLQAGSTMRRWSSPVLDGVSMAAVLLFIVALIFG